MARPEMKPEVLAGITAQADRDANHPLALKAARLLGPEKGRELLLAGNWLGYSLRTNGCRSELEVSTVCHTHGWRVADENADPWDVAQDVFHRWKAGLPLIPASESN